MTSKPTPLRALLLAPPGAGKGTQGTRLAKRFGVRHLATGDLLRRHVAEGTPTGLEAEAYMRRGDLVPDRLVTGPVLEHIAGPDPVEGFVLDGFPRTIEQAEDAYRWGQDRDRTFHAVISLDVPEEELMRRLLARGHRSGRLDDTEKTILERLRVYKDKTAPLLDYYDQRGILLSVDGTGDEDKVFERILDGLASLGVRSPD